jgi:geranylgeranyl diphosphate synthase type II
MNYKVKTDYLSQRLIDYYGDATNAMHFKKHDVVYEAVYYVLSMKGKKVRPLLLLHANHLFGGEIEEALPAAIAIELFHNFTLVHDDIMDKAPIRRGIPTIHKKYGLGTAINTGDLLMIIAYQFLIQIKSEYLREAFKIYNDASSKIMEGQSMDLKFEILDEVSVEQYLNMIELKTAVLIAFCMKLGSLLAGASPESQELMYQFGKNLGICFQLKDDWLDVYGDHKTGKMVGGDILQNKKTFLYVNAWQLANSEQKRKLVSLKTAENDQIKISETIQIYDALNIGINTEKLIDEYYATAMKCLDAVHVAAEKKQALFDLIQRIYLREY